MKVGVGKAPKRVRARVSFALQEATDDGHCGLPVESLLRTVVKLLDVDKAIVRTALDHELKGEEVIGDTIGRRALHLPARASHAGARVAERLRALAAGAPPWPRIDSL